MARQCERYYIAALFKFLITIPRLRLGQLFLDRARAMDIGGIHGSL